MEQLNTINLTTGWLKEIPFAHRTWARCETKGTNSPAMTDLTNNNWQGNFKVPRRAGKKTKKQTELPPYTHFPLQAQQGSELFKITTVDKACPAKFSLFEYFEKHHTWCLAREGKKIPAFPHASNQWGKWEMQNVKGSQPSGMDIIPRLLLGIWYINTTLEKH